METCIGIAVIIKIKSLLGPLLVRKNIINQKYRNYGFLCKFDNNFI